MSEKTQKRLVDWRKYRRARVKQAGLYSSALFWWGGAFVSATLAVICLFDGATSHGNPDEPNPLVMFLCAGVFGFVSFLLASKGYRSVKEAHYMARVAPITCHNTGDLPEVETLVRGSVPPVTDRPAELLRAARPGGEMPADQLLRAGHESRSDG